MLPPIQQRTNIEGLARTDLATLSYTVVSRTGNPARVTLVAVKDLDVHIICLRWLKRKVVRTISILLQFHDEIVTLKNAAHTGHHAHLWLYAERSGWRRFRVHADGTFQEVLGWTEE